MWIRLAALLLAAAPLAAQDTGPPLSAIDWLGENDPTPAAPVVLQPGEAPVTDSGAVPDVSVQPLEDTAPRRIGLVPGSVTGLPATLWVGEDGDALAARLSQLRVPRLPAAQSLLYTVILAEANPPATGADALSLARIDVLMRMGALSPALELTRQVGPERSAETFQRFFDAALLAEVETEACAIQRGPNAPVTAQEVRIFCAARAGDWNTATLLLGTANAVGELPDAKADLLARFLDPELFEGEPPLPTPDPIDPLSARVLEAIGQPGSTSTWPRVYAHLDLRDVAGWKAQLEATERLAETGAIDGNQLLGVMTARRPAASGGIWDRVNAVQRFETAIQTGSGEAVAKTLPQALEAGRTARMTVPLAALFAEQVLAMAPAGGADALTLTLLSPQYERAAQAYPDQPAPLARAIAQGDTRGLAVTGPMQTSLAAAFADAPADGSIVERARHSALGPAILDTLDALERGLRGDAGALTTALATMRALGLEDVARRAALQILLLERFG